MLKIPDKSSILILTNLFRIIESSMCMLYIAILHLLKTIQGRGKDGHFWLVKKGENLSLAF